MSVKTIFLLAVILVAQACCAESSGGFKDRTQQERRRRTSSAELPSLCGPLKIGTTGFIPTPGVRPHEERTVNIVQVLSTNAALVNMPVMMTRAGDKPIPIRTGSSTSWVSDTREAWFFEYAFVRLEGIDTAGVADGSPMVVSNRVKVVRTHTYTSKDGPHTVFVVIPVSP